MSVALDPERGDPLLRALTRVEAELLCEDADAVGTPLEAERSYEQRTVDALGRLAGSLQRRLHRP